MNLTRISVTIEGTTPLLCHRFSDGAQLDATTGARMTTTGDRGTPREQSERCLYIGTNGKPMIPAPNLFRAIIDAGVFFKLGKNKITTQKTSLIPACVEVEGIEVPIQHREPWTVDTRPVRNPSTGGRFLSHRPSFNDWRLTFVLGVDTTMMPIKLMREIVDAAGKRTGLGGFRPAVKGPFGKFVVVAWDEQVAKIAA